MIASTNGRLIAYSILTSVCLLTTGCGGGSATKVIEGTVSVAGQKADGGEVRFVPIEGTPGSVNASTITDGKYRLEARGGVPLGKYRVEVTATKKTGRQVMQDNGFEKVMGDELVKISPPQYAGKQSTIVAEITADSDGKFDINITQ